MPRQCWLGMISQPTCDRSNRHVCHMHDDFVHQQPWTAPVDSKHQSNSDNCLGRWTKIEIQRRIKTSIVRLVIIFQKCYSRTWLESRFQSTLLLEKFQNMITPSFKIKFQHKPYQVEEFSKENTILKFKIFNLKWLTDYSYIVRMDISILPSQICDISQKTSTIF